MARIALEKIYLYNEDDPYQKKFICDVLNSFRQNLTSFADSIHVTKQTVANWINGKSVMNFCQVAAVVYMWLPDGDAQEIYQKIKEENENGQKER